MMNSRTCVMKSSLGATALAVLLAFTFFGGSSALASRPLQPLPAPFYSFDGQSPTIGITPLLQADVLQVVDGVSFLAAPGSGFDLMIEGDDLDALSYNNSAFVDMPFALLFSVDRDTIGEVEPAEIMVEQLVPYNVYDQALKSQAAGDEFMSLGRFSLGGKGGLGGFPTNAVLVRNNYDEGGTDLGAKPPISASGHSKNGDDQDNVDAIAGKGTTRGSDDLMHMYFSLTSSSESLLVLPGSMSPSGASVFFNEDLLDDQSPTELYAIHFELGLAIDDDIDALIVFDFENDGIFNNNDAVLFSLAPGSPTLGALGASAADVLVVYASPAPDPMVFAFSLELGMVNKTLDNVDALDLVVLEDDMVEAARQHGIRRVPGDGTNDGHVTLADYPILDKCLSGPATDSSLACSIYDFDDDDDIDLMDICSYQSSFEGLGLP